MGSLGDSSENEWLTRERRIDPWLDAIGWHRPAGRRRPPKSGACRTEEEPTANGPADYALWLDGRVAAVVEALALANAVEKRVAAAAERAGLVTQAILAKAFRGELVPTEAELARREGREYEPADALLRRTRSDRSGPLQEGSRT